MESLWDVTRRVGNESQSKSVIVLQSLLLPPLWAHSIALNILILALIDSGRYYLVDFVGTREDGLLLKQVLHDEGVDLAGGPLLIFEYFVAEFEVVGIQ